MNAIMAGLISGLVLLFVVYVLLPTYYALRKEKHVPSGTKLPFLPEVHRKRKKPKDKSQN